MSIYKRSVGGSRVLLASVRSCVDFNRQKAEAADWTGNNICRSMS